MSLARIGRALPAGLVFVALLLTAGGCRPRAEAPALPPIPTTAPAETYTDPRHGFFIARPGGWSLERTDAQEGVILALASPDGAVSVRVVRAFPPPTIDLASYGRAMMDVMRLSLPGLQVTEEAAPAALRSGIPLYRVRFAVPGAVPQAGEFLVAIRARGGYQEAFLVQATGPQPAYEAWTPAIRTAVDSFFLAAVPLPSTPSSGP